MIGYWVVLIMILMHWFADFVCQTDWQAKNKSSNNKALLTHTYVYSMLWIPFALYTFGYSPKFSLFIIITFIAHTITDYFTSRLNTSLYKKNKIHRFFISIGFDQVLHYVQLGLTYKLLANV